MKKLFALLLLLSSPLASAAAGTCADAVSDPEIEACLAADLERADAEMNTVWSGLLAELKRDPEASPVRQRLIQAQRLWLRFRDADCGAVFTLHRGGTVRVAMQTSCLIAHTEQRTKELRAFRS